MENTIERLSSFNFRNTRGGSKQLSDHKGNYMVIYFWAAWASNACAELMKGTGFIADVYKGKNLKQVLIAIHSDDRGSIPFVNSAPGRTHPDVDCLAANDDESFAVADAYKITSVPRVIIAAPDGAILHHLIGPTAKNLTEIISRLQL